MGKPLFAELSPYEPLFQSVFQGVLLRLVLDYRLNGNEEAKDRVIDVFDYLHDQGWADGSGVGAMHHEFLRVAGYAHAVYLMRDVLEDTGRLDRELATLKWFSMFGELYEDPQVLGANADFFAFGGDVSVVVHFDDGRYAREGGKYALLCGVAE